MRSNVPRLTALCSGAASEERPYMRRLATERHPELPIDSSCAHAREGARRPTCPQLTRSWVRPHETIFRFVALVGARDGRVRPPAGWQRAPARPQREKLASVGVELRGGRSEPRPRRGHSPPRSSSPHHLRRYVWGRLAISMRLLRNPGRTRREDARFTRTPR